MIWGNLSKKFLCISLLLSLFQWSFAANTQYIADSLLSKLKADNRNDTLTAALYDLIDNLYYFDTELSLEIAEAMERIGKENQNQELLAKVFLKKGIIYDINGNYDLALNFYDSSLSKAITLEDELFIGDIYNNMGITHSVMGSFNESVEYGLKALEIYSRNADTVRLSKIYNNLGSRYSSLEYYEKALEYYEKAVDINILLGDSSRLAYNYGNIGLLYYDLSQSEKALNYFQKSIMLQDSSDDKYNYAISLHSIAITYLKLDSIEKALSYEERALKYSLEINDELGIIASTTGLAEIYNKMGKTELAISYYERAIDKAKNIGANSYLLKIYLNASKLFAQQKMFKKAFEYGDAYTSLNDSIMSKEKDKAIQKIKSYEDYKKEKEIEVLTKDSKIQELNIRRQKIMRYSATALGILFLLLALGLYHRFRYVRKTKNELSQKNVLINQEKEKSEKLLLNILPEQTAEELKKTGQSEARNFDLVTVMFTDFKGFTYVAEKLSPTELVAEIDHCFKNFDEIISKHGIEKIKTIGDAYMCAGGIPVANTTNPFDVVKAGLEIQEFMAELKTTRKAQKKAYFELRLGIHTGPVIAGIVGSKKFQYDIWGDTVNIAARMESSGEVGKVNISQSTYNWVKDQFICENRGKIQAKNKGEIEMYFVKSTTKNTS
jgi:adenylate cyclase